MTAADQPTTEPSTAGLRIECGWLVEETTGCTCAGGTEEISYLHEPRCGLTPLQRLDNLPGWPAPQPAADTETEVQWGVRYPDGSVAPVLGDKPTRDYVDSYHHPGLAIVRSTVTRTRWEEA